MHLGELAKALNAYTLDGDGSIDIMDLCYDSRKVRPGCAFICIKGFKHDGHDFLGEVLAKGASAVVAERPMDTGGRPVVVVDDTRMALAVLASAYFCHPSKDLRVLGVTGTNGKTTTTHLIKAILNRAGHRADLLGTVVNTVGGKEVQVEHTTPESVDLMRLFRQMLTAGSTHAVMEVSSHALELHRVSQCEFDIGVFTNLTQDHLDFHGTFDAYREAKGKLFRNLGSSYEGTPKEGAKGAVMNADDPSFSYFAGICDAPVTSYGVEKKADFTATGIHVGPTGLDFVLAFPGGETDITVSITGRFNVYNVLAASAACWVEGVSPEVIKEALGDFRGVRGRFELVSGPGDPTVIVDYAHTPDGLEQVLKTAREITGGRLHVVFGCGGDRDRTKRPIMGRIAGELADSVTVTSDNPRSEDPAGIANAVAEGVRDARNEDFEVIVDRRDAIEKTINSARPGDVVVVAGKGHETYQIFRDKTVPFDDAQVARSALAGKGRREQV